MKQAIKRSIKTAPGRHLKLGASISGGGFVPLTATQRWGLMGDSEGAGRGTGTGTNLMDGARFKSFFAHARDLLVTAGYTALMESLNEAANGFGAAGTHKIVDYYTDASGAPHSVLDIGNWTIGSANTAGGLLFGRSASTGPCHWTPSVQVTHFEIWVVVQNVTATLAWSLDSGTQTNVDLSTTGQGNPPRLMKIEVTCPSRGYHTIDVGRAAGTCYFTTVIARDDTTFNYELINLSARGWGSVEFSDTAFPWRESLAVPTLGITHLFIQRGTNNIYTGGPNGNNAVTPTDFQTAYSALLASLISNGVTPVACIPPEIDPTNIRSDFTYAQLVSAINAAAAANSVDVINLGDYAGTWADMVAASETAGDGLHYLEPVHERMAIPISNYMIAHAA